jgi:hypothetical protein
MLSNFRVIIESSRIWLPSAGMGLFMGYPLTPCGGPAIKTLSATAWVISLHDEFGLRIELYQFFDISPTIPKFREIVAPFHLERFPPAPERCEKTNKPAREPGMILRQNEKRPGNLPRRSCSQR